MWSWLFGRKPKPVAPPPPPAKPLAQNPANPGRSLYGEVRLTLQDRTWEEGFDCLATLAKLLEQHGREPLTADGVVEDPHSGYVFRPLLASCQAAGYRSLRTTTTIEITHPKLFPSPVFDFQHSHGSTAAESIATGFDLWCETDWPALLDASRVKPQQCTFLQMEMPATDTSPARNRRVIFGPVAHFKTDQQPVAETGAEEEHPFCSCCLFTKTLSAHRSLIDSTETWALRLFAARSENGQAEADCRANGRDYPPGQIELIRYCNTWPNLGVEFRKQYVVIHDTPLIDEP